MEGRLPKFKVVYRPLSELKPLEDNPRYIKEQDFEKLCASVQNNPELFESMPIILSDRTGELVIIAGNQRYRAAQEVGLKEVPTILLTGLTEKKEQEIIIRTNVTNGKWDWDRLANGSWEVEELDDWGLDVSFLQGDEWDELPPVEGNPEAPSLEKPVKIVVSIPAEEKDTKDELIEKIKEALVDYPNISVQ